jgi:ABC-2 type transport system permease protein
MVYKRLKRSYEIFANTYLYELKLLLKDSGVLFILFGASIFYSLIYTYSYSNEVVNDIDVAVVDLSGTKASRDITRMLDATPQMNVTYHTQNFDEAKDFFYDNKVHGIIVIPQDFERRIMRSEQAAITAYADASYFMIYKQILSGAAQVTGTTSAKLEVGRLMMKGNDKYKAMAQSQPVSVTTSYLFNPASGYASYAMPGVMLLILQQTLLLSIGMLGGTLREKKRKYFYLDGDIDPRHAVSTLLGKAFAFITLHLFNIFFMLVLIYKWFNLPQKGNPFEVFIFILPYIFAVAFLGISIASLFRKREHSLIFMFFTSIPFIFLSGFSWPASEMPMLLQKLSLLIPSTTAIQGYLRLNTMGASLPQVSKELFVLTVLMVCYFMLALAITKYRIKQNNREVQESLEDAE